MPRARSGCWGERRWKNSNVVVCNLLAIDVGPSIVHSRLIIGLHQLALNFEPPRVVFRAEILLRACSRRGLFATTPDEAAIEDNSLGHGTSAKPSSASA